MPALALLLALLPAMPARAQQTGDERVERAALEQKERKPRVNDRIMVVGSAESIEIIPGSASRIEGAELLRTQAAFGDIHRMLRSVPGVNVQEEEGFGLRPNIGMRGSGSERSSRVTLMEDGTLIAPAPYAAPSAYYFPTAGRMEAVEVRKGSSQIKFGPRTNGGALNLVSTRVPDAFKVRAELGGGSHATAKARLSVGSSSRNWGWMLETYQLRSEGFKQIDGGGDAGFHLGDYLGKLRYRTVGNTDSFHEIEVKLGYVGQGGNQTYLGLSDSDFQANPVRRYAGSQHDRIETEHRQIQLRHYGMFSPTTDLTTVAYRNEFQRNWYKLQSVLGAGLASVLESPLIYAEEFAILRGGGSTIDALKQRHNNREYYGQGIQSVLGLRLGSGSTHQQLEVGVRYHADQEDRFQSEDGYQMIGGHKTLTSVGAPGSQANRIGAARAWAVFVQDRISTGRWAITPGVRFESIDMTRTDYSKFDPDRTAPTRIRDSQIDVLLPGAGVDYRVGHDSNVFLGVHRGFAPPGPGAADGVRPETSINYELGYRYRGTRAKAGLTGFFNDYDNLLGSDTLSSGGQGTGDQFNGGAARVWGLEASAFYDFAATASRLRVPLALSYTWTRGKFRTGFDSDYEPWGNVEAGDELPYLPEHQLNVSLGLQGARWDVFASATSGSVMRTAAGQGPIPPYGGTDAFTVVDLTAGYRLDGGVRLQAAVQNALGATYIVARRPAGVRPGLTRTFVLGLTFSR